MVVDYIAQMKEEGGPVGGVGPVQIDRHNLGDQFEVPGRAEAGITSSVEDKLAALADCRFGRRTNQFRQFHDRR